MVDIALRFCDQTAARPEDGDGGTSAVRGVRPVWTTQNHAERQRIGVCHKVLEKLVAAAGINHRLVASYNPRANGVAERFVRTIKEALRKQLARAFHHWDQALPGVTLLGDQHQSVGNQQNGTVHLVLWQSGEPVGGLHGAGARAAPWAGRRGGPEQAPPRDGIESATGVAP